MAPRVGRVEDGAFYLTPNVDLKVSLGPCAPGEARTFAVVGPSLAVGCVKREADASQSTDGLMSPKARITLTERAKEQAGIPAEATHFAFMYPLDCFAVSIARFATGSWPCPSVKYVQRRCCRVNN